MKEQGQSAMAALLAKETFPKYLKGYGYLLQIGELTDSGMDITPAMLVSIGERSGKRFHCVNSSLWSAVRRLKKSETIGALIAEREKQGLYAVLQLLVELSRNLDIPHPE